MSIEKKKSSLKKLINKLPDLDVSEADIKALTLKVLEDIEGDSAAHIKAKLEALRLLHDIVKKENEGQGDISNNAILAVLMQTNKKDN